MNRIEGKNIVITGASAGIGQACAEMFAAHGAELVLVARRLAKIEELKERLQKKHEISVLVYELDIRDRDGVKTFAHALRTNSKVPDVLINNAGLSAGLDKLHEGDFNDWDRMIDTNIKGLLNISRCLVPMMIERNIGHIVNIGSIAGYQVYPNGNVYNATKFAVRALSEAMNIDLLGTPIRMSNISPGAVQTEFSLVRFQGDEQKAEQVYKGYTPLQPEDVAEAVHFVINAPEHVNIQEVIVMPTDQRSVHHWYRNKD